VYIFTDAETAVNVASDERILRCATHYSKTERTEVFAGLSAVTVRREGEKPCFVPDIGLFFSVSHSGSTWICAVSEQEVGIDIQKETGHNRERIAKRVFHPQEYAYLLENEFDDFFSVWTAKESYVKFTGQGIGKNFSTFSVVSNGHISEHVNGVPIRFMPVSDYTMCLCAADVTRIHINYMEPDTA